MKLSWGVRLCSIVVVSLATSSLLFTACEKDSGIEEKRMAATTSNVGASMRLSENLVLFQTLL